MGKRIIVVGGGLAGLSATIKAAEKGFTVDLFSVVPVKRSHSVCAQGGINAAKNLKGENDHPDIHTKDTLFGGEFLADQTLVDGMCQMAPQIIDLLDRMGVPFNRSPEGLIDFRRFGGTLHHRTAFSGATTGQQLMYALDEQVRRFEAQGLVNKFEYWEFLSLVLDDQGRTRGICAQNTWNREVQCFAANAVILATGGPGMVFGKSTNSVINTGAADARAYQQGVWYANGEFIQVHPTSIPGADKLRLISESVRGEGGRVWVPKNPGDPRPGHEIPDSERDYFLERKFPKYGNLVPRDVATREIFHTCVVEKRGVHGGRQVYLDITPKCCGKSAEVLEQKLGGVLEIYRKFVGDDPLKTPMRIFPGMHYSMGGLWVGHSDAGSMIKQMTNVPGTFAAGEVDFQYHGANRLGANSLLSCIYGGFIAGERAVEWVRSNPADVDSSVLDAERRRQEELTQRIISMNGSENPWQIHRELGDAMSDHCTVVRDNKGLDGLLQKINELEERWEKCSVNDTGQSANQAYFFTRALRDMLELARAIAKSARLRDECRGAHYKPEFELKKPEGDKLGGDPMEHEGYRAWVEELRRKYNAKFTVPPRKGVANPPEYDEFLDRWLESQRRWMKTTMAKHRNGPDGPEVTFEDVVVSVVAPVPRIYK